jgi:hypothetical protein
MALNITSPLNTSIGVTIPSSYARIAVNDAIQGTALVSTISVFATKQAFESGADPLPVMVDERLMDGGIVFSYNRELNGADILELAHMEWVAKLSEWGITSTIDL